MPAATSVSAAPRIRAVPAVTRAIAILRLLGRSPEPLGVKAIAQSLDLVTSTCLHILRALVAEELVKVDPLTKRYALGMGMLLLARSVLGRASFASLVQPTLDRLARDWEVTAIGVDGKKNLFQANGTLSLAHGTITFSGLVAQTPHFVLAVTGGTGKYVDAGGKIAFDFPGKKQLLTVTLRR